MKNKSAAEQLDEAVRQRQTLNDSLGSLRTQETDARTALHAAQEQLDRHEGDHLIGVATETVVAAARTKHEAALKEHRRLTATIRQTQQSLAQLEEVIGRLRPGAQTERISHYVARQEALATELRERLEALVPINQALHENYLAAEAEFPEWFTGQGRGVPRGYPVAAGLQNMSWHEFRRDPHAMGGGRLALWLARIEQFLRGEPLGVSAPVRRATVPTLAKTATDAIRGLDPISVTIAALQEGR